jgi:hypothetical protein
MTTTMTAALAPSRVKTLEQVSPGSEHNKLFCQKATSLFPQCDPYYLCLVVATRKQESSSSNTTTAHSGSSTAAQQRTNIYAARNPIELVERLNKGLPITEAHGIDLASSIAHLLPQEEQPPSLPPPPPPPQHQSPEHAPALIPPSQWPRVLDPPRNVWIYRAGALVVGMSDVMPLIRGLERRERQLDQVLLRIEHMQHELAIASAIEEMPNDSLFPIEEKITKTTSSAAAPLQNLVAARRLDNERKRRRRQKQEASNKNVKTADANTPQARDDSSLEEPIVEPQSPPPEASAPPQQQQQQNLGMVIGPLWTLDAARAIGVIWCIKSRGSIPRSALGEVLAECYKLNLYANLAVILEGEEYFKHHVLRQAANGELWLVERTQSLALDKIITC